MHVDNGEVCEALFYFPIGVDWAVSGGGGAEDVHSVGFDAFSLECCLECLDLFAEVV